MSGHGGGGKVRGVADLVSFLQKVANKFPDRVGSALYTKAEMIMTEAKRRTPVAKNGGQLRASGRVHSVERHGKNISVMMSFGGAADAYAIAVHEHLSEHSPPSWVAAEEGGMGIHWNAAGTGPKFLEGPINEERPHLLAWLADRVRLDEGGGQGHGGHE